MVLTLKRFLPDKIRDMLQTADLNTYKECKEYASKQSRVIRNEKVSTEPGVSGLAFDAALKERAAEDPNWEGVS